MFEFVGSSGRAWSGSAACVAVNYSIFDDYFGCLIQLSCHDAHEKVSAERAATKQNFVHASGAPAK